jgi:hypothetical protein
MVKNKKGWIKIAEAFLAILLLTTILLIIITGQDVKEEKGKIMNQMQGDFLRRIQLNETFREDILMIEEDGLPTNSSDELGLNDLNQLITEEFGNNCFLNLCLPEDPCEVEIEGNYEVYTKDILITCNKHLYSPKKVKFVCYE